MNEITSILKEIAQPLLQRAHGVAILFIFFVTGFAIPHVVPPLMEYHPLIGAGVVAALTWAATRYIARLQRDSDT